MNNEFGQDLADLARSFEQWGDLGLDYYGAADDIQRLVDMPLGDILAELATPLRELGGRRSGWQSDIVRWADILDLGRNFSSLEGSDRLAIVKRLLQQAHEYVETDGGP